MGPFDYVVERAGIAVLLLSRRQLDAELLYCLYINTDSNNSAIAQMAAQCCALRVFAVGFSLIKF